MCLSPRLVLHDFKLARLLVNHVCDFCHDFKLARLLVGVACNVLPRLVFGEQSSAFSARLVS